VGGRCLPPGAARTTARNPGHRTRALLDGGHLDAQECPAANTARGPVALAHNGNVVNAEALKAELEKDGAVFQSSSATEVILHLLARAAGSTLEEQLPQAGARREWRGRARGAPAGARVCQTAYDQPIDNLMVTLGQSARAGGPPRF
jgi:hypothetical protein